LGGSRTIEHDEEHEHDYETKSGDQAHKHSEEVAVRLA
jgi:hypothetical protein